MTFAIAITAKLLGFATIRRSLTAAAAAGAINNDYTRRRRAG